MASTKPEQIATVGDLRAVLADLSDEAPVWAHVGVDVPITEWDMDTTGGLVLFPDDESGVSFVSTSWLDSTHPEMKG